MHGQTNQCAVLPVVPLGQYACGYQSTYSPVPSWHSPYFVLNLKEVCVAKKVMSAFFRGHGH